MSISKTKVLCFTTSYKRPYHLYNTVNNILNQTYTNFLYSIGICVDSDAEKDDYLYLLDDFVDDKRIKIFFHNNQDQHSNYLYPIKTVDYEKFNLFAKIDDDDIYKKKYLATGINTLIKNKVDIVSSTINYEINNNVLYKGYFDNIGGYWYGDTKSNIKFGMPFSYIFNSKCLDILLSINPKQLYDIHPFEDAGWRTEWRKNNIRSYVIKNSNLCVYNIHGKNISSSSFLLPGKDKYLFVDTDIFILAFFHHFCWESYVLLNKKHNICYNISNNDLGTYRMIDNIKISIKWEKYTKEEIFSLNNNINNTYYTYVS